MERRKNSKGQLELPTGEDETVYALMTAGITFVAGKVAGYDTNFAGKAATLAGLSSIFSRFFLKDKIVSVKRTNRG